MFCKKPLPLKPPKEPEIPYVSSQQREFAETRNFPAPVWAVSSDQGRAADQMQQSQGSRNIVSGTKPAPSSSNAGLYYIVQTIDLCH